MEPVADDKTIEHTEQRHPGNFQGKESKHVSLTEAHRPEHTDGGTPFAHVSNRHDSNSRHAHQQTQGKIALKQGQDGKNQRLDDRNFFGDGLNVDVL